MEKINGFEIIEDSGERRMPQGNILWRVRCQCGKEKLLTMNHIKRNKSCGCLKIELQRKKVWKGHGEIGASYWNKLKSGALNRDLPFEVTIEYAWDLFLKQNRQCALTGVPLAFSTRSATFDGSASLDRIDSECGYVQGNVQWVHKDVNFMKQQFDTRKFLDWCEKVYEWSVKGVNDG